VSALVLVFAGVFAVYKFYFAEKLATYAQHKELLSALQAREAELKTTFGTAEPDDLIRDYRGKVEAWNDAIVRRAPFFQDQEWREHEKPPQDVFILQFWYGDETKRMIEEIWEDAQKKYGAQVFERMPEGFPYNLQTMLGVVYAAEWQGRDVKADDVNTQLERLSYGISALRMLMDANAQKINMLEIQELGGAGFISKGVKYTRLKLSFMMNASDLVDYLDGLRTADSFYSVEGMRISHPYVLHRYEPLLTVDMYLLRAKQEEDFVTQLTGGGTASAADVYASSGGLGGAIASGGGAAASDDGAGNRRRNRVSRDDEAPQERQELGFMGRTWKWIKRNIFFTN
jgi:hypothetical protein